MRKALLALLMAASVTPALAQEKTFDLKISHWVPASHPLQKALEDWAARSKRNPAVPSNTRCFRPSSSARRSTITTWRATVLPTSPTSIPATSPAVFRSSARASCRS